MKYLKRGIGFLKRPGASFDKEKKSSVTEAFKYMLLVGLIMAILSGIVYGVLTYIYLGTLGVAMEAAGSIIAPITFGAILVIVSVYVVMVVFNVIFGLWLHLWAYLLDARGLNNTMKSVFYGGTPEYFFGWLSSIYILGWYSLIIIGIINLWRLILTGMGLNRLHRISKGRAAVAVIVAYLIPMIVAVFLVLYVLGMFSPYTYVPI